MFKTFLRRTLALAFVIAAAATVEAQYRYDPAVFAPVEESNRGHLSERLELLIDSARTQDWGAFYDLLTEEGRRGLTREQFSKAYATQTKSKELISAFIPSDTRKFGEGSGNQYVIEGLIEIRRKGRTQHIRAFVVAELRGKEWFFASGFGVVRLFL